MFDSEDPHFEEKKLLEHVDGLVPLTSASGIVESIAAPHAHIHAFLDALPPPVVGQSTTLAVAMDGACDDVMEEQQNILSRPNNETAPRKMRLCKTARREMPNRYIFSSAKGRTLRKLDRRYSVLTDGKSSPTPRSTDSALAAKSDSQETQVLAAAERLQEDNRRSREESSGDEFSGLNVKRSLLYNWYMLRMGNIKIMGSMTQNSNGSLHDFDLLRLMTQTYEDKRWWTILIDDLACPQCVAVLWEQRVKCRIFRRRDFIDMRPNCNGYIHCDGGHCNVFCNHINKNSNEVTRFFSNLGLENARRMRNIVLETSEYAVPDADALVSAVHNVGRYFPDVKNLEIIFHFGDAYLERDVWTRFLCLCRRLERYLPKGGHLRVRGIEKHTKLQNGWTRKGRRWHE